jgi:peptide deformylase
VREILQLAAYSGKFFMALLPILHYPDPRLHKIAAPVASVDDRIRKLIRDMGETMYAAPGIGLAATQVDVHERVLIIDISDARDELQAFVNPVILETRGEAETEEGCLSVPGVYDKVRRAEWIRVEALNAAGERFTLETEGLLAVCIQHEIDHLDGKVFVDYLSRLKQTRIAARMKKQHRAAM